MAPLRRAPRIALALLVAAALALPARASEVELIEQKIKAGLLYNFLKYTQWPAAGGQANPATVVCLIGGDPFDGHLQPMAGRTVNESTIEIRNVAGPAEAATCSMLVVNATQKSAWPQLRDSLTGKHVLTVSDFDGFATTGGMIEFTRVDNRVGVALNPDAIAAAHLEVQDRLLKLASVVHASGK